MKENYVTPEAEVIRFVSEENLANDEKASFIGWDITDKSDGDSTNWGKWFGEW